VRNHELLASSPPLVQTTAVSKAPSARSNGHSTSRTLRSEQSAREVQHALPTEDCANAVARDRERIAAGLYDTVIHRLFAAGLQLQATCQVVEGPARLRIEGTIDLLDTTISELRKAIFSLR
jgi:signal transduction histidine kinase